MTTPAPTPVLSVEGVYKSFGAEQVLEGVSLEVPEHTVTVLIGASGSGKSTLLRCINLLTSVDDGVIRLDGWDITDPEVEPDEVRRKVGMVFQSFNLFPHLTVLDNITLSPRKVHKVAQGTRLRPRGSRSWSASASRTRPRSTPTGSPGASSSASRSCAPWRCRRG